MNKKIIAAISILIILLFIGYMIFDTIRPDNLSNNETDSTKIQTLPDSWKVLNAFQVNEGSLKAVAVSASGNIYLGGDSFVSCYNSEMKLQWNLITPSAITSLSNFGDTIFASTADLVLIIGTDGKIQNEWGPYEDKSIITSVSSNAEYVAIADAGNKMVFILDKGGEVKKMVGQNDGQFVIPSPYFDVALDKDNILYTANTGHHRIETRTIDGTVKGFFGEPGTSPERFCGCCAPAHFILVPQGFVTAEKGINRVKVLNRKGEFIEFVSAHNHFVPSNPLDLASADGITIYAANPADSKLYVYIRK